VHKKLAGRVAGMADPGWPQGRSVPQGLMLSVQTPGSWPGAAIAARGQAGRRSLGGEQLHCASLVLYILL